MIWWMWFSWLSLNREIHPYPCNNSFYSLLMARVGCVSRFHGCHELGYFDCDGFMLLKVDDDTRLCYRGGTTYAYIYLCAGFLVLMAVIKTCETSIPKQLLSHRCSDGLGWTSLMLPWLSWTWFSTVYIWLLQANKHALLLFCSIWYFSSATSDHYQNVLNHDQVWGHILLFAYDAIDE